jgi:PAS domain S-box-containing protein
MRGWESVLSRLAELKTHEAALTATALDDFCRLALAGMPGGAFVSFDHELRVDFAAGLPPARAGVGPMVGRRLPDLMTAASWKVIRGPYEAALAGRTSRFDFEWDDAVFSIHVSPFVLPGGAPGALAVSYAVSGQRRLQAEIVGHEGAVAASEELFRRVFDSAPVGITVIGRDGRWLRVNLEICRMLGYERDELIGASIDEFTHPDDIDEDRGRLAAAFAGESELLDRERRCLHKDGSVVWVSARSERVRDETGKARYLVVHLQDISERRVAEGHQRDSDRRLHGIVDNATAAISVKGRDHRYQLVNRSFQQWCGLPSDRIVGFSAEEMASGPVFEDGSAKDQRVLDGAGPSQDEDVLPHDGIQRVFLTARFPLLDDFGQVDAVGCTSVDITEGREAERAKRERLQSALQIQEALAENRFVLYGQPIINLATMATEQAELLIRMRRTTADSELVPPGEFLPAAERFGHIGLIDEWVFDQAVQHAAAGHRVEVNLSAKTISDVGQVDRIERAVLASKCPPENLIFEVTETAIADHLDAAREFAIRLRTLGCAFALDDFGIGHGTFTYLKHLAVDYLKIDIEFVRDLLTDPSDRHVVQAIIGVAKQFDIKTIAEGVEDQAILKELRFMGADYAQGYWTGRPVPLHELWKPLADQEPS